MPSGDTDDDSKYLWSSAVASRVDYSAVPSGDTDQWSSAVGSRVDYSVVLSGDTDSDSKYTWNSTVGSSVVEWGCAVVPSGGTDGDRLPEYYDINNSRVPVE